MIDVLIVGGGPAGLSAALALGRARKRVLLCDAGAPRNALAVHLQNFVTRDGTPPSEFRAIGRAQLKTYPTVEVRDTRVHAIRQGHTFQVELENETVHARRILLCTGMIDEMLPLEGFADLWGHAIYQCPYCHGWEVRDRRWGYLALGPHMLPFALQLRGWTDQVTLFTNAAFELPVEMVERLSSAGIQVEEEPIARLVAEGHQLTSVAFQSGRSVECDVLFAHPPQHHVKLVDSLGLALDDMGFVQVDPMTRETSVPGIYAGGDLITRMQTAVLAAGSGMMAAAMLNHALNDELS
ncbi:MAG: NAD(P)/FAD-dependent oxidoreductase [Myxococcota bacterium]